MAWLPARAGEPARSAISRITGVSGTGPNGTSSACSACASSTGSATRASSAGVQSSKIWRGEIARPALRAWPASIIEVIESPPSTKKSSSGPACSRCSTSAKSRHSTSSASVAASRPALAENTGCGSAARSSLPFAVTGSASSTVTEAGTR